MARIGFEGRTPDDPVEVHRLCKVVHKNLKEIEPPEPRLPGYVFDASLWQKPIAELLENAEESVTRVAEEKSQAEATLTAKRKAIEEYDRTFSCTANLVSALLQVAGEKELARRVRPSTRRVGQTMELANEPTHETA